MAGVYLKALFGLGIMVLTQLSLSRLKQSEISILIYLRFCLFFNFFLGDFWVYLGINSLSERISENYAKREF